MQSSSKPIQGVKQVGDYVFEKTVGEGQFGKVKTAIHIPTGTRVAIKIINKQRLNPDTLKMVSREIHIMKMLRHPHIIRLYEVINWETMLFLVMEYASGGEVMDLIMAHGKLRESEACRFFTQTVQALAYCHANRTVHRDVKAENLLLDENMNVKLIDFGLSNVFTPGDSLKTFCGSPTYASPELVQRHAYTGPEVDCWSLGVLLYVLVAGALPFDGDTFLDLYKKIIAADYVMPSFISPLCADLIRSMLQPDVSKRATIQQIRKHPWIVSGGYDVEDPPLLSVKPIISVEDINEIALNQVCALGVSREVVIESLVNGRYDELSATYYLCLNQLEALRRQKLKEAKAAKAAQREKSAEQDRSESSETKGESSKRRNVPGGSKSKKGATINMRAIRPARELSSTASTEPDATPRSPPEQDASSAILSETTDSSGDSVPTSQTVSVSPSPVPAISVSPDSFNMSSQSETAPPTTSESSTLSSSVKTDTEHEVVDETEPLSPQKSGVASVKRTKHTRKGSIPLEGLGLTAGREKTSSSSPEEGPIAPLTQEKEGATKKSRPVRKHGNVASSKNPTHFVTTRKPISEQNSPSLTSEEYNSECNSPTAYGDYIRQKSGDPDGLGSSGPGESGISTSLAIVVTEDPTDYDDVHQHLKGGKRDSDTEREIKYEDEEDMTPTKSKKSSRPGMKKGRESASKAQKLFSSYRKKETVMTAPRTLRFAFTIEMTSAMPADDMMNVIGQILAQEPNLEFEQGHRFLYIVAEEKTETMLEIEVCRLPHLELNGVRFHRITGDSWRYKEICKDLRSKMSF